MTIFNYFLYQEYISFWERQGTPGMHSELRAHCWQAWRTIEYAKDQTPVSRAEGKHLINCVISLARNICSMYVPQSYTGAIFHHE